MTIVPFCDNKYPTVVCDPLWECVKVASDEHDVAFAEIGARSGYVDLLVLKDDMSVTWVFCKGIITMLTTKPSMLPIMLPSSKVASLDRVLSITCTNIIIFNSINEQILHCQQMASLSSSSSWLNLDKFSNDILAHLPRDLLNLFVDLRVVLVLQQLDVKEMQNIFRKRVSLKKIPMSGH